MSAAIEHLLHWLRDKLTRNQVLSPRVSNVKDNGKRRFWFTLLLIGVLLGLGAGWWWQHQQPKVLRIATASQGGEYDLFARALAEVITRHQPHLRLQVLETKGSAENVQLLEDRQVELALAQNDTPLQPSVQVIAALFPEVFHLVVAPNAKISSIPDLRGKRIALMPKGSGSYNFFRVMLRHYGLEEKDLQSVPLPLAQAQEQFRQGKVDGIFRSIALGNENFRQLIQAKQAQLVPVDQTLSLQSLAPFLSPIMIPKGLYQGYPPIPPQDLPAASVRALLLTRADIDPEVIFAVTQTLYDYRNELAVRNARAATISSPADSNTLGLPVHPGAENYYNKYQPSFLERYAESIALLITVGGLLLSLLWELRQRLARKQKNRSDAYNLDLLAIIEQAENCPSVEQLNQLQHQVLEIFRRVITDLDLDRLTPEGFQAFAISLEMTLNAIRHREMLLSRTLHPLDKPQPPDPMG